MKLIVGLGNPGKKYQSTRHNVGFLAIDAINKSSNLTWHHSNSLSAHVARNIADGTMYAKPDCLMNNSGKAVKRLLDFYKITSHNLFIIHDDLDLRLGTYKIQKGKGPATHKGIFSIEESLGTPDFWRIRIGIDNRDPKSRHPGEAYVLKPFPSNELAAISRLLPNIITDLHETLSN